MEGRGEGRGKREREEGRGKREGGERGSRLVGQKTGINPAMTEQMT